MRSILVDWLVDVCLNFKLHSITLFHCISLIDRFLDKNYISKCRLQLLGVSCLLISCKFHEIYPPSLKDFVRISDMAYSEKDILNLESSILLLLNFNLTIPTSLCFLEYFQIILQLPPKALTFCKYMLETIQLDISLQTYLSSEIAAGAIILVTKIFHLENCRTNFKKYNTISENVSRSCAKDIYQIMRKAEQSNLTATKRKFGSVEHFEVSKYKIEKSERKS